MERIVVGVDGSETSHRALEWAVAEARLHGCEVEAVHAWHDVFVGAAYPFMAEVPDPKIYRDAGQQVLDAAVDEVAAKGGRGVKISRVLVNDSPVHALLDVAKGADLIVIGSRGRGGFAGLLLGSVSQQIVHHAVCPVVVVPPSED